jgi:hypothetical protein
MNTKPLLAFMIPLRLKISSGKGLFVTNINETRHSRRVKTLSSNHTRYERLLT